MRKRPQPSSPCVICHDVWRRSVVIDAPRALRACLPHARKIIADPDVPGWIQAERAAALAEAEDQARAEGVTL